MKIMYNIYFLNILSYAHFDYNDKKTSTLVVKPALSTRVDIIFFYNCYHVLYAGKGRP